MSGSNSVVSSRKAPSTLMRPRFGPGMLLQHDDLEQLSTYTRELSRMLFRSLFGCGVVCGLEVTPLENCGKVCISVDAGLALTCGGDPIYVPKKQTFSVDENCELEEKELWVVLCGASKCCAPRTSMCPTDEDETSSACTRERDWFELKVVRVKPKCVCECDPALEKAEKKEDEDDSCLCMKTPLRDCYKDHYAGKCGCDCEGCEGDCGDCLMLAKLTLDEDDGEWKVDHSLRRFVRPILMRDPLNVKPPAATTTVSSGSTAATGTAKKATGKKTPIGG